MKVIHNVADTCYLRPIVLKLYNDHEFFTHAYWERAFFCVFCARSTVTYLIKRKEDSHGIPQSPDETAE